MKKIILISALAALLLISCAKKGPAVPDAAATKTPTPTRTAVLGTPTNTSIAFTATQTASPACSFTESRTDTATETLTATPTFSVTETITPSWTISDTSTCTPTFTITSTITPTCTVTNTFTATNTPLPKTFGFAESDMAFDIIEAPDLGFIIAGSTTNGFPDVNAYIIKTDSSGNLEWDKTYGTNFGERLFACHAMSGGYMFTGNYFGGACNPCGTPCACGGGSYSDVYRIKTDFSGNTYNTGYIQNLAIGGTSSQASSIKPSGAGSLSAGRFYDQNTPSNDAGGFIARFDDGANNFSKTYGILSETETFTSVLELSGGGIIAAGYSSHNSGSIYITQTDNMGNELAGWPKYFDGGKGEPHIGFNCTVLQRWDNSLAFVSNTNIMGAGTYDGYIIITDTSGNCLNSRTYGTAQADSFARAVTLPDGSIVAAGVSNGNVWMLKAAADLSVVWDKTYFTGYAMSVAAASDGGFVATGFTSAYGAGSDDIFILKTDAGGNRLW